MTLFAVLFLVIAQQPAEPEPIVIPPPPPIHGLVVDEDGRPVEGAELFLRGFPEDFEITKRKSWTGRSDAQGRFVVDTSSSWLAGVSFVRSTETITAYRPGSRPAILRVGRIGRPPADPLRIVLRPVATTGVPLRVVDSNGSPVAGAKVLNRFTIGNSDHLLDSLESRLSVTTDSEGRANLSAYSPEDVTNVTVESKAFGLQSPVTDPKAKGEQTLILLPVGRLSGRVVLDLPGNADGLTFRGITFAGPTVGERRVSGSFEVTTKADGRFEIPALVAGSLMIWSRQGHANLILDRSQLKPVEVQVGKSAEVELMMKTGIALRGVLREREAQRPVVGATVTLRNVRSSIPASFTVRTDRSGQFKGFLFPGDLELSLGYAGPYVLAKARTIKAGTLPANTGEFDVGVVEVVEGVNVRGLVLDEDQRPVPGATIEARTSSDGRTLFSEIPSSMRTISDAGGEFVLENMAPGLSLEITASLGEATTAKPTVVTPGKTKELPLFISRGNTVGLGGRVVDEYGKPIVGATMMVRSRWKTSEGANVSSYNLLSGTRIITDADGKFQVPRILSRHAQHQAEASVPGRPRNSTEWFASTTPSFFELTLFPTYPSGQSQIWADHAAAWAADNAGDLAEAETRFKSALKGASEQNITDPIQLSSLHAGLAFVLVKRGQIEEAEKEARSVVELREKALPAHHPERALALRSLADVWMRQQKFDQAETLQSEALAIIERRLGPNHPEFGRTLFDAGYLAMIRGREVDSLPLFERAGQILETVFGPDCSELIDFMINHGYALSALERFDEAEGVFRRALKLSEKIDGLGAPRTADIQVRLVDVLRRNGKNAEADALEAPNRPNRDR